MLQLQVFKILTGEDRVQRENWFIMAAGGGRRTAGERRTSQAAGIQNVVKPSANLEVRSNFFTVSVTGNKVPDKIKMAHSVGQLTQLYKLQRSDQPQRSETR
jgi:hypothetical protein